MKAILIGISALIVFVSSGCNYSHTSADKPMNDKELHAYVTTHLKPGDSRILIEQFLKRNRWKYEFSEFESQYVARYESGDTDRMLEKSGVVILLTVNESGKLTNIQTYRAATGL